MENVEQRLKGLEALRGEVRLLEEAMQSLTPEERLVLQLLVVAPEKRGAERLCSMLGMELSSVYRRRRRALQKLEKALKGA